MLVLQTAPIWNKCHTESAAMAIDRRDLLVTCCFAARHVPGLNNQLPPANATHRVSPHNRRGGLKARQGRIKSKRALCFARSE